MDKQEILKEMGGIPEEVYDDIVKSFYDEARGILQIVSKSISNSDYPTVAKLTHGIKGSAANLYLTQIQEAAKCMEVAAKAANAEDVRKYLQDLVSLIP